jgi:ribosome-binding factor A
MSSRPESPRTRRVADRLAQELAGILTTKTEDPRLRALTVTGARVSRDLSSARVWVSGSLTPEDEAEVLKALAHAAPYFRTLLAPRLGLRIVPSLHFVVDHSIETGTRIEQLLRELHPPEGE